jgi:DNA-directed RNA polymerase subunit L
VRITVGSKSVAQGNVEIKLRRESQNQKVSIKEAADKTIELVNSLKKQLNC